MYEEYFGIKYLYRIRNIYNNNYCNNNNNVNNNNNYNNINNNDIQHIMLEQFLLVYLFFVNEIRLFVILN